MLPSGLPSTACQYDAGLALLVASGATGISPPMAHELTRMAATVMLETSPHRPEGGGDG